MVEPCGFTGMRGRDKLAGAEDICLADTTTAPISFHSKRPPKRYALHLPLARGTPHARHARSCFVKQARWH